MSRRTQLTFETQVAAAIGDLAVLPAQLAGRCHTPKSCKNPKPFFEPPDIQSVLSHISGALAASQNDHHRVTG